MTEYNIFLSTHKGNVRKINEDSFVINDIFRDPDKSSANIKAELFPEPLLCEVFDGMGGEKGGFESSSIASAIAVDYYDYIVKNNADPDDTIGDYVTNCTIKIREYLSANKLKRGGTTFAMAFCRSGKIQLYSMGDSRIYLYKDGVLRRVSCDHTLAQKKYKANIFTKKEAEESKDNHVLTRFLGMDTESPDFKVEIYDPVTLNAGDKLMLCTDGLYDMCSDKLIDECLASSSKKKSIELTKLALKNGGKDNITCMIIEPVIEN